MQLYTLNPLQDGRWDDLVSSHPRSSAFHQRGWIEALAKTYRYRPVVLTCAPPGVRLSDGLVCEIDSWITGSRLVSLPFSDHSEPLLNDAGESIELGEWMREERRRHNWKYVEFRPLSGNSDLSSLLVPSQSFWFHSLDLKPSLDQVYGNFHKSCIQRRIQHAERQELSYEKGRSDQLVNEFYELLMITRSRHQLLPQPRAWIHNLIGCMGENAEIRVVRKGSTAVAAILTLRHRRTIVYKYGCSAGEFHSLAGMPLLFWKLIQESKTEGMDEIDFGRTDMENVGLTQFKDRFGTLRKRLTYYRYGDYGPKAGSVFDVPATRALFAALPHALSSRLGGMVYRHFG
jgi:CelD/BcsL family acetyltransferase involved in cellulose biosynthesis